MTDTDSPPRWIRAKTSGLAHLDLSERSATSPRAPGQDIIVTACRGHLTPDADVVPDGYRPRCSNCSACTAKLRPDRCAPSTSTLFWGVRSGRALGTLA
jgi:Zn-dependent alcohol dehydrogenase